MINLKDLKVNYGANEVLNNIDLEVPKNTTCAIIGSSGCGKTTLLYTIAGLISPTGGRAEINGEVIKGIRKDTGLILQSYGLLPWKNVWDNVIFPLKARGEKKEAVGRIGEAILQELDILKYRYKYPEELSGGERQRVAIGRTLALKPDLLLIDEATSALDAITKERLQDMLLKIYQERELTLVMVTHNIEEAVFLGQRIVVIDKGSIKEIIDNPYFGDKDIRGKEEFYTMCLKVRGVLNG